MKFINFLNKFFTKNGSITLFLLFLIFGLTIFFYPMFTSNFDLMAGYGVDPKLINYTLEHYWLNLIGVSTHASFWDMPFYYPMKDTLVLSDMVYGVAPIYLLFRFLKLSEFSAFQGTMIVTSILNYCCFYYLLKKCAKFSSLASAAGSFLFSFSLMRCYRLTHFNYFIQFYSVLVLIFLIKINKQNKTFKNILYSFLAAFSLFMQCISTFMLAYYLLFVGFYMSLIAICFKDLRKKIINYLKDNYKFYLASGLMFLVFISPILYKYFSVESNTRPFRIVDYFTPDISCWILNVSKINQFLFSNVEYINPNKIMEASVGIGLITSIIVILAICFVKNKGLKITLILTILIGIILSCRFNDFIPWQIMYNYLPAAKSIRAIVRISFGLLIIFSFLIAYYFDFILKSEIKFKKVIAALTCILVLVEHIPVFSVSYSRWESYKWSKKEYSAFIKDYSNKIEPDCEVLVCEPQNINKTWNENVFWSNEAKLNSRMDCMYLAKERNIYTSTGYTGTVVQPQYVYGMKNCRLNMEYDYTQFR